MHHAGQPATAHDAEDPGRRAHSVAFEQAGEVPRLLTGTILPPTDGR